MKNIFVIREADVNSRLDRWFKRTVFDVPQSLIEKNIRKGNIKVNSKKEKSSYKLKLSDKIIIKNLILKKIIKKKDKYKYTPSKKDLTYSSNIFIENNDNFVVINKPSGIPVQSGTKSKRNIIDILQSMPEFKNARPFTVHRIDKETTGILVVAKNRKFAQFFTTLFRIRKIHKVYLAIVIGTFKNKKGKLIDELIYYEGEKKIKSKAITNYSVINANNHYSLVELSPETGRKHQLRRQLLINGNPVLGDSKYRFLGNNKIKNNSLMLHAYKINFSINDVKYKYSAETPDIFKKTLKEKFLKIF